MAKHKGKGFDMGLGMGMDWTSLLLGVVMMALGIWFLVGAFSAQFNGTGMMFNWNVAVWYAIGIALVWYGKMWSHKGCGCGCCNWDSE